MGSNNNQYSFFNYKSIVWLPFFLGILVVVTVVFYLNFPSGYNQGIYHYQGLVIKNGGLPYTGFIEKKGPMGLLTYSLAAILFGETVIAYRVFDLIILVITGYFLFRLVRLNYSKLTSWLVSVFWLHHVLIDGPGNTGDVTNIITACYVALAYHLLAPKTKKYCLVAGVLIALACWVKPTALLIAMPLIFLCFDKDKICNFNQSHVLKFLLGMLIPTIIFILYLLISGTFYGFWESVVLDTIFNYTGYVSRFSTRTILKTGWTFLNDPVLRIGGVLSLFIFSKNSIIKLIVAGIGLMLFVEGRLYPYQFSILWPFLTIGIVEGFIVLSQSFSEKKQKILVVLFCIIMTFPAFKIGSTFIQAGFLTSNFDVAQTFIFPDFRDMYNHRKSVVSYLKKELNTENEVLVLGQDPNIYLELGVITTCRLARDGAALTGKLTASTPSHLIAWQEELLKYMNEVKADWIIVSKTLPNFWIDSYKKRINSIFSEKYQLEYETDGHLIYKKRYYK
ncbi:glycosyltransferase family 39 protein [Aquimarina sp. AU119]|uniref:ArnT family glycosyltransferase n=1 Tax=Aquimarina sp. AU119 TaxID=2108528 RepID=UPI000D699717|nr:glycosyltransferase family 39 protein [Aquimarina sp. AU119]